MTLKRVFWVTFAITMLVYLAMVMWSLPNIARAAEGLLPFDLRPAGYTLEEARLFLSKLSDSGKAQYLGVQHRLDTFYPGLLALTLTLAYFLLFSRHWAMGLTFVALGAAIFDWNENIAVADLLRLGAEKIDEEVVSIAALFTVLKSATVAIALSILLVGLAMAGWRKWRKL